MILLILCWVPMALAALLLGHGLLAAADGDREECSGDWVVLAFWLGMCAWGWLAAVLSLIGPVTPGRMAAVVGLACAVALATSGGTFRRRLLDVPGRDAALALAVLAATAAFVAANLRPTPDTGAYHIPAIRWLAEQGVVTGIAHIQDRFGFISSVSALLAPFDTAFDGRLTGVVNGFVMCLLSGQVILAASRIARGVALASDVFLGTASTGLLVIGVMIGSFSTPSSDPTVAALTVVIAWRLLAVERDTLGQASLVPLLLGCGALNAKLSGLLLLPVVGLYAVFGAGVRRWIVVAILSVVLVAPFFVASILASGCFAMPASIPCLPVPGALPTESVKELA